MVPPVGNIGWVKESLEFYQTNTSTKMSILEYNGSAIVAMCGKNCVAIASYVYFSDHVDGFIVINNDQKFGRSENC